MKTLILFVFVFATASVYAEPPAPTPEQVAEWVVLSKPVNLSANKVKRGERLTWGDTVWVYGYSAKKETLYTFVISLYKAGTLYGKNRSEMEKRIGEQAEKFAELAKKSPDQETEKMAKYVRIETRPDGRKVYFTVTGFGPGGAGFGGFTTIGQYDLLLEEITDSEDGLSKDQKLKNPAQPTKELPDILKQFEQYIISAK
ncbi:MAG: hypothetical protein WCG79_10300 [Verrucomicrobiota bacterium]